MSGGDVIFERGMEFGSKVAEGGVGVEVGGGGGVDVTGLLDGVASEGVSEFTSCGWLGNDSFEGKYACAGLIFHVLSKILPRKPRVSMT